MCLTNEGLLRLISKGYLKLATPTQTPSKLKLSIARNPSDPQNFCNETTPHHFRRALRVRQECVPRLSHVIVLPGFLWFSGSMTHTSNPNKDSTCFKGRLYVIGFMIL